MYKLIIGNVRVSVLDDNINVDQAAMMAREAISTAGKHGKLLSQIEIASGEYGPEIESKEKLGHKVVRKTIKQSMVDGVIAAAREKLFPNNAFMSKDSWFDGDTGQEWHGDTVNEAREEIMLRLENWLKNV